MEKSEISVKEINRNIINSIEILIDSKIKKLKNNDVTGIVTGTKTTRTGKVLYRVDIDSMERFVKDGINLKPDINTPVWVHIPNGRLEDAYICALR